MMILATAQKMTSGSSDCASQEHGLTVNVPPPCSFPNVGSIPAMRHERALGQEASEHGSGGFFWASVSY